jgi:hypothetical protein
MPESAIKQPVLEVRKAHRDGDGAYLWMYVRGNPGTREGEEGETLYTYDEIQVKVPIALDETLPDISEHSIDQSALKERLRKRFVAEGALRDKLGTGLEKAKAVDAHDKEATLKDAVGVDVTDAAKWDAEAVMEKEVAVKV